MEALRAREPDALEQLLEGYGKLILAWARDGGTDPEDVLQDVMLRVWRSCHRLTPDTHLPAWLKTITKNTIRDRWRAAARKPALPVGLDPAGGETVDPTAQERSRLAVQEMLTTLRDRERNVLELLYLDDLPLNEVSRRLDLSEEATKSLAARARRRLRGNLERLVASTPVGVIHLLVGRAAEAGQHVTRSLGTAGAALMATAAATAVVAGGVSVERARQDRPEPPPGLVAHHATSDGEDDAGAIRIDPVGVRTAHRGEPEVVTEQESPAGEATAGGDGPGGNPQGQGPQNAPDGLPEHAGQGGPPEHAGQGGPPEHAGQGGKPDHAGQGGPPEHAGQGGPPEHAGQGGKPEHAGQGGKPEHAGQGGGNGPREQGSGGDRDSRPACAGPPEDRPTDCDGAGEGRGPDASGGKGQRPA